MSTKLLCIGDMHLGRRPSRIPDGLDAALFEQSRLLDHCIEIVESQGIDAVVFVGDLVDEKNALFAGYASIAKFVRHLSGLNVSVIAIAGNHDFDVLPALAKEVPSLIFLGQNSKWDQTLLDCGNKPKLRIQGKSFSSSHSPSNPLSDYTPPGDDLPTIALLHCDVDSPQSQYAPVTLHELRAKAPNAWLLGHIHKPNIFQEAPGILYLGSLQGLDPGETGPRGPWLLEADDYGKIEFTHLPLAPIRYETIRVDLSESDDEPQECALSALNSWYETEQHTLEHVKAVLLRIVFYGDTEHYQALLSLAESMPEQEAIRLGQAEFYIEKVIVEAVPRLNLSELALQNDPPGLLAKRLQILREKKPEHEYRKLIGEAKNRLQAQAKSVEFLALQTEQFLAEGALRMQMIKSAGTLLENLLAQKDQRSEA